MFIFHIRYSHMDTNMPQSGLDEAQSNESYDQWVSQYRLREKVHCPPDLRHELNNPVVKFRFEIGDGPYLLLTLGYTGDTTFI